MLKGNVKFNIEHVVDTNYPGDVSEYWAIDEFKSDTTATMGDHADDGTPNFWVDVCVNNAYYITARDLPDLDAAMSFAMSCICEYASPDFAPDAY